MIRPFLRSRPTAWSCLILALLLGRARGGAPDTAEPSASENRWTSGRAIPIEVKQGRATFDIPTPDPKTRTLVIVSALAKEGGPFPIRLAARPVEEARPISIARPAATRPPKAPPTQLAPLPKPVSGLPASRRTFHLLVKGGDVARASNYLTLEGRLTAVGSRIQIYVDEDDLGLVASATLRDLVETFDRAIFPKAVSRFGPAADVDGDGRFTVLFSSWLTRLAGGKTSVDGFVRGADMDMGVGEPFGNRCDMMYLSTALKAGPHLRTIVAHEYTHAVSFSRKALAKNVPGLEEEGWLDEGIAHLVEDDHGFSTSNVDYRVSAFLSKPERYRLVVQDYYTTDLFRSHGNRGATYLFLRWCVDRYGPSLLDSLVRSNDRGIANLEAATGSTFDDLFRRWAVALSMTGLDPTSEPEEAYRSIDPRGEIEDWVLAGPRMASVKVGGPEDRWFAEATTAHYAIIERSSSGAVEVEVVGPPWAELQVTALRLPEGSARPELTVKALPTSDGISRVRAEVVERDGNPVRLGALAWEPLVPLDDPRAQAAARGGLDMLGIASTFGTSALPGRGTLRSGAIRLPKTKPGDGPLVFKAVGTDARGRRVAAWAELSLPTKPESLMSGNLDPN